MVIYWWYMRIWYDMVIILVIYGDILVIYDDIWWYICDMWWYVGDIWWYMVIYDDIWWYMVIYLWYMSHRRKLWAALLKAFLCGDSIFKTSQDNSNGKILLTIFKWEKTHNIEDMSQFKWQKAHNIKDVWRFYQSLIPLEVTWIFLHAVISLC